MDDFRSRTRMLLGEEATDILAHKTVLLAGLGGVGGTALEALVRSGVGHLILIDDDDVEITNLNRQLLFTREDLGKDKCQAAETRLRAINPDIDIRSFRLSLCERAPAWFEQTPFDAIVDAIDHVPAKAMLAIYAVTHRIPIVTSLGMGKRLNPGLVETTRLDLTHHDPLGKRLRALLRKQGIDPKQITAVFSRETPQGRELTPSSMMFVPSACGLQLAYQTLCFLLPGKMKERDATCL